MSDPTRRPTNVFIVSGPSGSGKSTLVDSLIENVGGFVFSVSYTTRQRRGKEVHGQQYFFVGKDEFLAMRDRGEFLEWAEYNGRYYGTANRFCEQACDTGKDLLLDIDVQGASAVRKKLPGALSAFVLPPSKQALLERLKARNDLKPEEIASRVERARTEIQRYREYDLWIINKDREPACAQLNALVLASRMRTQGECEEFYRLVCASRGPEVQREIAGILKTFECQEAVNG